MRAELVDQPDAALRVAEGDEPLGEKLDPHRRTIRLGDLLRHQRRDPVAAEQVAHRRVRPGLGEEIVLLARGHRRWPLWRTVESNSGKSATRRKLNLSLYTISRGSCEP